MSTTANEHALEIGVPKDAIDRLTTMQKRKLATSDLSVDEFLLTRQAGFRPLGFVLGAAIYHVPYQGSYNSNMELTGYTQAMYDMRQAALMRMEAEADVLCADGIVGVHFKLRSREFGTYGWEFIAYGTAVVADEAHNRHSDVVSWRNNRNLPFTSDLSGQAFWKLIQAGYAPLGLVMGNCAYHIRRQTFGGMFSRALSSSGQEIPEFTQGVYDARELAMGRMQAEAEKLEAETVVEFKLSEYGHGWDSHAMEFLALGTAVRAIRPDHTIDKPVLTVPLGS